MMPLEKLLSQIHMSPTYTPKILSGGNPGEGRGVLVRSRIEGE